MINKKLVLATVFSLFLNMFTFTSAKNVEVKVIEVASGDSFSALLNNQIVYIKLNNIKSPEVGENYESESTEALKFLILNKYVEIETDKKLYDKNKKLLVYAFCNGKFINEIMLYSGLTKYEHEYPNYKYFLKLITAENFAKDNELNLFKLDSFKSRDLPKIKINEDSDSESLNNLL